MSNEYEPILNDMKIILRSVKKLKEEEATDGLYDAKKKFEYLEHNSIQDSIRIEAKKQFDVLYVKIILALVKMQSPFKLKKDVLDQSYNSINSSYLLDSVDEQYNQAKTLCEQLEERLFFNPKETKTEHMISQINLLLKKWFDEEIRFIVGFFLKKQTSDIKNRFNEVKKMNNDRSIDYFVKKEKLEKNLAEISEEIGNFKSGIETISKKSFTLKKEEFDGIFKEKIEKFMNKIKKISENPKF